MEKIKKNKEEQYKDFEELVRLRGGKYCNKCFDRGYKIFSIEMNMYIPCTCLLKKAQHIELEKKAELCKN